ncbi:hypothetical protein TNIN_180571 [Trichonephila inaurata madagascariensis]|uniref:Uncharacterized protein n=1 Tax=Trichonephila inaurata madagascariensis TaxID=2747483 RepID=A0A8X7BXY2_9ARAC|nr:hypothetical protein TNIN_180571 [Trichonephila inaurata madagascariensis]
MEYPFQILQKQTNEFSVFHRKVNGISPRTFRSHPTKKVSEKQHNPSAPTGCHLSQQSRCFPFPRFDDANFHKKNRTEVTITKGDKSLMFNYP